MSTPAEIKRTLKALKKTYQDTAKAEFKAGMDELFAKYPDLHSVGFTAYTPYFNDGDECRYYANTEDCKINGFDAYDNDDGDEYGEGNVKHPNLFFQPSAKKCVREVRDFLNAFDGEIYKDIVGDHVEVTITRKGVSTAEYSHD